MKVKLKYDGDTIDAEALYVMLPNGEYFEISPESDGTYLLRHAQDTTRMMIAPESGNMVRLQFVGRF